MKTRFLGAFALCVFVVAATVAALGAVLWAGLDEGQRTLVQNALANDAGALLLVLALILILLAMLVQAALAAHVARPLALAEETRLIAEANPRHRLQCTHPRELAQLASAINGLADRYEAMRSSVDSRIAESNREVEKERNLLAALMAAPAYAQQAPAKPAPAKPAAPAQPAAPKPAKARPKTEGPPQGELF